MLMNMNKVLVQLLAVGAAGFAGAVTRWAVTVLFGRMFLTRFPLGTLFINVSGSFFLGWFLTYIGPTRHPTTDTLRLAIATGFVGAYTTFSTWMYDSGNLMEQGAVIEAWVNVVGSLALGLLAVWAGVALGRR